MSKTISVHHAVRLLTILGVYIIAPRAVALSMNPLRSNKNNKNNNKPAPKQQRQIDFEGNAMASIQILDENNDNGRTLQNFLTSQQTYPLILGSEDVTEQSDGTYHSILPSITWFGLEVEPRLVNRISYSEINKGNTGAGLQLSVCIENSCVEMKGGNGRDRTDGLIANIMKRCSFGGGNQMLLCRSGEEDNIWVLSSNFSLTLTIPLGSRLMILPPGFQSIGSRIVRATCDKRVKENLAKLKEEYQKSIDERQGTTNEDISSSHAKISKR